MKQTGIKLERVKNQISLKYKMHKWIILVLLTFPHLKPEFLEQIPLVDIFVNGMRVISSITIAAWFFFVKKRLSSITILVGLQQLYLFCNTVTLNGAVRECIITSFSILSVVILYDIAHDESKEFLSSQLFCFEVLIYINFITEVFFPDALYIIPKSESSLWVLDKNWFLGFYNSHTQYYIPALMVAFLYQLETGKKIRTYVLTIIIYVSAVWVWSGGVLISLFGMGLAYILLKNYTKIFHYYSYWMLHVLFFVFIILLKMQNLFKWLIDGVLGKWRSLELRMTLWDKYCQLILKKPIFGYGVELPIVRQLKVEIDWAYHAHNQFLDILYKGGIVNLLLFILIVFIAGKNLYRFRETEESKIISLAFLGWCLHGLVEPFMSPFLMGMFVIAYYSNERKQCIMNRQ